DRPDRHVVVEANPNLIPVLERNCRLNGCKFTVINKALAYDGPTVAFGVRANFVASGVGHKADVGPDEAVTIATTTLERTADDAGFDRFSLICDIEGAEAALVGHEIETLRARVPFLLVEVHPGVIGTEAVDEMFRTLADAGFTVIERCGDNL